MANKSFIAPPLNIEDPIQLKRVISSIVTRVNTITTQETVTKLNQTIIGTPTKGEVQAISNKLDEILEALKKANIIQN